MYWEERGPEKRKDIPKVTKVFFGGAVARIQRENPNTGSGISWVDLPWFRVGRAVQSHVQSRIPPSAVCSAQSLLSLSQWESPLAPPTQMRLELLPSLFSFSLFYFLWQHETIQLPWSEGRSMTRGHHAHESLSLLLSGNWLIARPFLSVSFWETGVLSPPWQLWWTSVSPETHNPHINRVNKIERQKGLKELAVRKFNKFNFISDYRQVRYTLKGLWSEACFPVP